MAQGSGGYARPVPAMQGAAGEFYGFCKKHELRFQRCKPCGAWRHVPREMCASCGSFDWEWAKSSGRGKIFTWTTVYQPMHPAFADVPYSPVIVELEEGVRMVSWVVDVKPEELEVGLAVEVTFDDVTPEVSLPKFRRAGRASR